MDSFVEDFKVQEAALCVLLQLSESAAGRGAIATDAAIPRVFTAMDTHVKNELVRACVFFARWCVSVFRCPPPFVDQSIAFSALRGLWCTCRVLICSLCVVVCACAIRCKRSLPTSSATCSQRRTAPL